MNGDDLKPRPISVALIAARAWPICWALLFASTALASFARPDHPDPNSGFTVQLKTLPGLRGPVFIRPIEADVYYTIVATIFIMAFFIFLPLGLRQFFNRQAGTGRE